MRHRAGPTPGHRTLPRSNESPVRPSSSAARRLVSPETRCTGPRGARHCERRREASFVPGSGDALKTLQTLTLQVVGESVTFSHSDRSGDVWVPSRPVEGRWTSGGLWDPCPPRLGGHLPTLTAFPGRVSVYVSRRGPGLVLPPGGALTLEAPCPYDVWFRAVSTTMDPLPPVLSDDHPSRPGTSYLPGDGRAPWTSVGRPLSAGDAGDDRTVPPRTRRDTLGPMVPPTGDYSFRTSAH